MSDVEDKIGSKKTKKVLFTTVWVLALVEIIIVTSIESYRSFLLRDYLSFGLTQLVEAGGTALIIVLSLFYLISRVHYERVSAMITIFASAYLIYSNIAIMTYGDFTRFITSFFILLLCSLQIAFSIDLFRGMKESATILKPIMLINLIYVLILCIYGCVAYGSYYSDWYYSFYGMGFMQLIINTLAFISLFNEDVLGGHLIQIKEFPRIPILASILVVYGLIYLLDLQPVFQESNTVFEILANVLFILVGLFFLIYRNVDVLTSVSFMLFTIGFSSVIKSIPDILSTDGLQMILGIVTFMAGAVCIILCALMYSGDKFNTKRLQLIMLILLIASVVPIIFDARIHPDPAYLVTTESNRFLTAVLVGGTFIALTDKSIKYSSLKERMSFNVHTMNNTVCNDSDAFITRTELYKLYRKSGWIYNDGPVEKEKTANIFLNETQFTFTVRKWSETGKLTGEIHSSNEGTYIQATRFDINKVIMDGTIEDCDTVTIYGDNGFFIVMPVLDEQVDVDTKKIYKLFYKIIGHKNKKIVKERFTEFSEDDDQSLNLSEPEIERFAK